MNLQKMNPMARKLGLHSEGFTKALEEGNAQAARQHIHEVLKFAGYLSEDISSEIAKSDKEAELVQDGGNPVQKMNATGQKFDVSQRDKVLPGVVIPARTNSQLRVHRGTFGRYSTE